MKKHKGKISIVVLFSVIVILVMTLFTGDITATPIGGGTTSEKLGAYTGPVGGAQQDDNVKASLDLAHTDLDAILAKTTAAGALVVGEVYSASMTSVVTGSTDDLFTVANGAIEIISFFGQITTIIASDPGNVSITINATAGSDYDADFSIVVDLANGHLGDIITFGGLTSAENAGVLAGNENAGQPLSWFCPAGVIEQKLASTGTGAVKWYMTYRILDAGVTVTAM